MLEMTTFPKHMSTHGKLKFLLFTINCKTSLDYEFEFRRRFQSALALFFSPVDKDPKSVSSPKLPILRKTNQKYLQLQ